MPKNHSRDIFRRTDDSTKKEREKEVEEKIRHQATSQNKIMTCTYGKEGFVNFCDQLFSLIPYKSKVYKTFNYFFSLKKQLIAIEDQIKSKTSNFPQLTEDQMIMKKVASV